MTSLTVSAKIEGTVKTFPLKGKWNLDQRGYQIFVLDTPFALGPDDYFLTSVDNIELDEHGKGESFQVKGFFSDEIVDEIPMEKE